MGVQVTNNAWGQLSIPITAASTTLLLTGGQGERFPSATDGVSWFYATLVDSSNNIEIVKCTARQADTLTVVRGQDGTSAKAFAEGSRVEVRPVAALFNDKVSKDEMQSALTKLESAYKEADTSDFNAITVIIDQVKSDYATNKSVEAKLQEKDEEYDERFVKVESAESSDTGYLLIKGGTLTGPLKVAPTSGATGLTVTSKTGAGIVVSGGDLSLTTYYDAASGRTYGGNITASAAIKGQTIRSTSDARKKHDIEPFFDGQGAALARALNPVCFKWNETNISDVGLIAQDVMRVVPEVVFTENDGSLSINYSALVAVAFAAIRDLQKEIEELKCLVR